MIFIQNWVQTVCNVLDCNFASFKKAIPGDNDEDDDFLKVREKTSEEKVTCKPSHTTWGIVINSYTVQFLCAMCYKINCETDYTRHCRV